MQQVIQDSLTILGRIRCIADACLTAQGLRRVALRDPLGVRRADLAQRVAEMELACEQLRLIVGSGNVDLAKVEALAALQERLRHRVETQQLRRVLNAAAERGAEA